MLAILVVLIALLVPAAVNRGAFLFPDTTAYVRGADAAVLQLTGHRTAWSDRLLSGVQSAAVPARIADPIKPGATGAGVGAGNRIVLAGRSIYYGGLLYLAQLAGGFWPLVLVQALLVAVALTLTVARFGGSAAGIAPPGVAALVALALLTPMGFFAAFAVPDIFAPLAVLASAHVALAWTRAGRGERLFWFGLTTAGALFHSATLLLVAALAVTLLAGRRWWRPTFASGRAWPLLLAIGLAIGGELLFGAAVRHGTGHPPLRPPFLTARLIDDGPGMTYLRGHCGDPAPAVACRYLARLPMPSDGFLWDGDPRTGVFKAGTPDDQRALAADEGRFVRRVVLAEPAAVIGAALRNAAGQAGLAGLSEFNYDGGTRAFLDDRLPTAARDAVHATAAYRDRMPTRLIAGLALPLALLSLVAIGWAALRRGRSPAIGVALWLVAGVAVNAALCGAMSGPHDRYGARIVWLLPLAAGLALGGRSRQAA